MNEIENKKKKTESTNQKVGFLFPKINKIGKPLVSLIKEKSRKKIQILKIENERGDTIPDPGGTKQKF